MLYTEHTCAIGSIQNVLQLISINLHVVARDALEGGAKFVLNQIPMVDFALQAEK